MKRVAKSWYYFILINLLIAVAIPLSFCPECFTSLEGLKSIFDDFVYSFVMSVALSGGISTLSVFWSTKIPWLHKPLFRFLLEVVSVFVYSFSASFIISLLFYVILGEYSLSTLPWARILAMTKLPIFIAYILTFFFTARSFLFEWRQAAVNEEKLRTEQFAGQYRLLRDQLNPHFLFNALNALSNLVHEDAERSEEYILQLSRFYRYVLDVQDQETVPLAQEMEFAQRYVYLQKLRFGENLEVRFPASLPEAHIPPLTLQLLLENAIKHNVISNAKPLKIEIKITKGTLQVINPIQLRTAPEGESIGVGLENIKKRYGLLSNVPVNVTDRENRFEVHLPLLHVESNL